MAARAAPSGANTAPRSLIVSRFSRTGVVDRGFGTNGHVTVPLPNTSTTGDPATTSPAVGAIAVQRDGKLLVGGTRGDHPFVARFTENGTLDSSFGEAGTSDLANQGVTIGVGQLPDGRVAIAAYGANGTLIGLRTPSGQRDPGLYDGFGEITYRDGRLPGARAGVRPTAMAIDRRGGLLLAGTASGGRDRSALAVTRLIPSGRANTLDQSFGRQGVATAAFAGSNARAQATAMALDRSGRIVIAGSPSWPAGRTADPPRGAFLLARLGATGRLDRRFGKGGRVATPASGITSPKGLPPKGALAVTSTGKILLAGTRPYYQPFLTPRPRAHQRIYLVRYHAK